MAILFFNEAVKVMDNKDPEVAPSLTLPVIWGTFSPAAPPLQLPELRQMALLPSLFNAHPTCILHQPTWAATLSVLLWHFVILSSGLNHVCPSTTLECTVFIRLWAGQSSNISPQPLSHPSSVILEMSHL